jgi:lipoprotein signal peptidase
MDNRENNNIYFLVSTLLIIFDQSTKLAVKGFNLFGWQHEGMYYGESIPIWGTFLQLTYIENPGMAFGIEFGWVRYF